jgi:hypothetical protein
MHFYNFLALPYFSRLRKLRAYILLETLAATALAALTLIALINLGSKGKKAENNASKQFKTLLKDDSLRIGPCKIERTFQNLKLMSCGKDNQKKFYISGFSTLEVAISIGLIMPCFLALAVIFSASAGSLNREKTNKTETYNIIRIKQLLSEVTKEIDLHPFLLVPRIHKNGLIRFTDGKLNKVVKAAGANRPLLTSDAITYLRLNILDSFEILSFDKDTSYINACSRYGTQIQAALYENYLVIGPSGFFEGVLHTPQITNSLSRTCINGLISFPQSMIGNPAKEIVPEHARFIIPIERIYTLYTDRKKILRFLGHRGQVNIENQPILQNSPELNLKTELMPSGLINMETKLVLGKRQILVNLTNRLQRVPFLNYLLNRP